MSKPLTDASVSKLRAGSNRVEIPDGGCRGLYLIIHPTGAKGWALRYRRPDGRPAKLVLGTVHSRADAKDDKAKEKEPDPTIGGHLTLAAAHRLVSALRHEITQGRDPGAVHLENRELQRKAAQDAAANTFAGAARKFVDEYTVPKKSRKPRRWREIARILGLDYPAAEGDPSVVKGGLVERWADRPITEIDGHDIHVVIDESRRLGIPGLAARNDGVSDARGRKMADALGSMFKWLARNRKIATNPCANSYRPEAPEARDRILTAAEIKRFWVAAGELGSTFGPLLRLLLLTGCRLNEVAGMTRDEIDGDEWTIPGNRTKNGRPHVVHLTHLSKSLIASAPKIEKSRLVFTTTGTTPVSGWSKIKLRLDEAMGNPEPWRLHDLRRTAATGMADLQIAPHIVEAVLNHVSGAKAGVAGTYNRAVYKPEKKAALERWANHVDGLVSGRASNVRPFRGRK